MNSLETNTNVPTKPIKIPNNFFNFNSLLKKVIPIKRVNKGVIPFRTAATEESIAVSAYANKNVGKKVPK